VSEGLNMILGNAVGVIIYSFWGRESRKIREGELITLISRYALQLNILTCICLGIPYLVYLQRC